ncbi:thiosulfate oxidation carrier protein SoxY, partial [Methylococcaceae bacterium HT4]
SQAVKDAIIGSKKVSKDSSKIKFTAPEIAENGKVVPIKVELPGIHASKVKSLHIVTAKNGNPKTADVFFTKHNEEVYFQTRFKMGKTQDVTALVVMQDGSVLEKTKNIKITIGGCG